MNDQFDNPMKLQAKIIPTLLRGMFDDINMQTRRLLSPSEIHSVQKIILTGSGDSYCAVLATKSAFELFTKLPVDVLTTIEIARYLPSHLLCSEPKATLVIVVSNSGNATRGIEAAIRSRQNGALTVAITSDDRSPLATHCDKVLKMVYEKVDHTPGIGNYAAMLATLYLFAISLAEGKYILPLEKTNEYRNSILKLYEKMDMCFGEIDSQSLTVAKKFSQCHSFEFIGSGSDYASAWYGQGKIYEALGKSATFTDTENWFHINFFNAEIKNTMSLLIVDTRGLGLSRAIELAQKMSEMGKELIVLSNDPYTCKVKYQIQVADCGYAWLAPMSQFVPIALIAGYLAKINSETYFRGFKGPWSGTDAPSTTNSAIKII